MAARRSKAVPMDNDWAFIEEEDEGSIETRKDSVVYRKPTYSEIVAGLQGNDINDGNESEPEFEILTGFRFRQDFSLPPSPTSVTPSQPQKEHSSYEPLKDSDKDDSVVDVASSNSDNSDDADDGIMIISTHFNAEALNDSDPGIIVDDNNNDDKITPIMSAESEAQLENSFVSLAGWNQLTGMTTSGAWAFGDHDWDDVQEDQESTPGVAGWNALPFFLQEDLPSTEEHEAISSDDLAGWNELTSLKDQTDSFVPTKDEGHDAAVELFGWDQLPFYDCDLKDMFLNQTNDNDTKCSFIKFNSQPGIREEFFWKPFNINGQKEYLSITTSGSFRTIPCDDDDDNHDDDVSTEEGSSIEFIDPNDNTDESFVAIDGQTVNNDDEEGVVVDDDDVVGDSDAGDVDETLQGWMELPFMTTSGTYSFNDDTTDSDIECINTTDVNESSDSSYAPIDPLDDGLDLRSLSSLSSSICTTYTEDDESDDNDDGADSDDESVLFPSWLEDDIAENRSDASDETEDSISHLYVDIPTFIILLCLTTALGFSIGHGVSVYLGNQAISKVAKLNRPGSIASPSPGPHEQSSITAEQDARLELWALEDRLYQQREEEQRSHEDMFDIKSIHNKLREKHLSLLNNHKNVKQRLQISKMMSWYWRLKYDEERRRQSNSSRNETLYKQIEEWKRLYMMEKVGGEGLSSFKTPSIRSFRDIYNGKHLKKRECAQRRKSMTNRSRTEKKISPTSVFKKYEIVSSLIPPRRIGLNNFRMRWTQGFKDKYSSYCSAPNINSDPSHEYKVKEGSKSTRSGNATAHKTVTSKKCTTSDPLVCFNIEAPSCPKISQKPAKVKKRDDKKAPSKENVSIKSGIPVKPCEDRFMKRLHLAPCFDKPVAVTKPDKHVTRRKPDKPVAIKKPTHVAKWINETLVKPKKGETTSHKYDEIRRELLKKREIRRKERELKMQANELKLILVELRRERRLAEKEKHQLQKSWRALKRQQAAFEGDRIKLEEDTKIKSMKTLEYLNKERKKLQKWKRDEDIFLQVSISKIRQEIENERVRLSRQQEREILNIRKELKLEKRTLREQKKDVKNLKKDLRKERCKFAKIQARKKRVVEKLKETLKSVNKRTKPRVEKVKKHKKRPGKSKQNRNKRKTDENNIRPKRSTKVKPKLARKKWTEEQERFWRDLERRLDNWVQNSSEVKPESRGNRSWRIRRNKALKHSKEWQERLQTLVLKEWKALKKKHKDGNRKQGNVKVHKKGPWKDDIVQTILAEQREYDKKKRQNFSQERNDTRSRLQRQEKRADFRNWRKKKHKRHEEDPEMVMRKRRRKQRRKYQRELERLHQWALQMHERKLEHERIYKEKRNKKCPTVRNKQHRELHQDEGRQDQIKPRRKRELHEDKLHQDQIKSREKTEVVHVRNTTLMVELKPHPTAEKQRRDVEMRRDLGVVAEKTLDTLLHRSKKGNKMDEEDDNRVQLSDAGGTIILSKQFDRQQKKKKKNQRSGESDDEQNSPIPPNLKPDLHQEFPLLQLFEGKWAVGSFPKPKESEEIPYEDFKPELHQEFPMLLGDEEWAVGSITKPKEREETSSDEPPPMRPGPLPPPKWEDTADYSDRSAAWYVRRAVERDMLRKGNPLATWFPPHDFTKSDGAWFFRRAGDREEQRVHPPWYVPKEEKETWQQQTSRPRKRHRVKRKDGSWFFKRADDRSDQRFYSEPWYMRRAAGRESDRQDKNIDNWWLERGWHRDELHNDYDDTHDDDKHDDDDVSWFPWRFPPRRRQSYPCY